MESYEQKKGGFLMPTLTILQGQTHTAVEMPSGATLLEGLRLGGFPHVDAPCGGKGRCGRCLVEVSGQIAPPSPREHALLAPARPDGWPAWRWWRGTVPSPCPRVI